MRLETTTVGVDLSRLVAMNPLLHSQAIHATPLTRPTTYLEVSTTQLIPLSRTTLPYPPLPMYLPPALP